MALPKPDAAKKLPAALEANIEAERRKAETPLSTPATLTLPYLEEHEITHDIALSPISDHAMRAFEALFFELRRQDRRIKRYQVMDAMMRALDDPAIAAAVVSRIRPPK